MLGRAISVADVALPTRDLHASIVTRARHSALGRDGPPAAAWQAQPRLSAAIFLSIDDEVRAGHALPVFANMMPQAFLPKGSIAGDELCVSHNPATVRPLRIKIMDMCFFAGGWNFVFHPAVQAFIMPSQRGFMKVRSIVRNLLDLDAGVRRYGIFSEEFHLPIIELLDIKAAFPSIAHSWLRRVLHRMHFLDVFLRSFEAFLFCVLALALADIGRALNTAFAVRGGVIQGCPMSATLSLFAFEPFLYALHTMLDCAGHGLSRAAPAPATSPASFVESALFELYSAF